MFYLIEYIFVIYCHWPSSPNRIGGIVVSMLASSAVDCGFEPQSCQTKDYKIVFCCFSAKHTALRRKGKDWLAQNQNNVSEWSDIYSVAGGRFRRELWFPPLGKLA